LWMGTFHSVCARLLRAEAEHVGFTRDFTIYDAADQKSLIIFSMVCLVGVVGGDYKYCIFEPRLFSGRVEELAQSIVGIAYALVNGKVAFGENRLILIGHIVWMMARSGKHCRHKRLLHFRHGCAVELQERFVPDSPSAVEVGITAKARIGIVLVAAVISTKARATCKSLKSHASILRSVEKASAVTFLAKFTGKSAKAVHRSWHKHKRLDKHRNRRQHRRHSIDALASIAVRIAECCTMLNQRINKWRKTLIFTIFQVPVKRTNIFPAKTFNYQNHDIFLSKTNV
ncbi:MAG: UvrD-helicase domain-containing protein, partial [Bacteroidales bacterium]|nr:UvrD-helicase domain-containing protein [Bacteroidales bacterium]